MTIGELIKKTRIKVGKSQKELADMVGLSPNAISKIESNLRGIKPEEIKKFAKCLEVSPEYLLTGNLDENKKLIDIIVEKTKNNKLRWHSLEDEIEGKKQGGRFFKRLKLIDTESELNIFKWADVIEPAQYIDEILVESPIYCKTEHQLYILYGFGSDSVLVGGHIDLEKESADIIILEGWLYNLSTIRETVSNQISSQYSTVKKLTSELSNL